ncbi:sensor histidine kinase [Actinoplanes couchii]|uniref:histidine kinase n=1 Tax=Actinoplanes couchii TaxID=403638 RepID=A0ABQ3X5Z1_9ACTN|nr:histidine kinase [Actinoplanes couchii]MDR6325371.1 signal transduction histidine kinase [Actinoplanes couchii]GID53926.1 two-component sensor histidine kinase [Actinoplanes couchii]
MAEAVTAEAVTAKVVIAKHPVLVDLLVSCAVAGLSLWWWHQFRLGGLVFGVLVGTALMWRRHRPLVVLAVVGLLAAVISPIEVDGTRIHEGMLLIAVAVATYAVVAHAATLWSAAAGGIAGLLWAAFLIVSRPPSADAVTALKPMDFLSTAWQLSAFAAVVWAAGLSARFLRQQRVTAGERRAAAEREREQSARLAIAEERAAIARELHDIVAHSLSVMILQANGGKYALDHDVEQTRQALTTISATGADALEEIRQLVRILRDAGESATPLGGVDAAVERAGAAGLKVELRQDGAAPEMPDGVALAIYRIVQESLTNTLRHGGPETSAVVHVRYAPGAVDVEVTDDGTGGPPSTGGHGLVGMRERALLYGGSFDAGPVLAGGWRVRARIPLGEKA